MRRLVRLATAALALLLLVGACSDDDGADATTTTSAPDRTTIGVLYDVGGLDDQGLNTGTQTALLRAERELAVEVQAFEPGPTGTDRAELLDLLADGDVDLVIAVGGRAQGAVEAAAEDHPDTPFVLVGGAPSTVANVTVVQLREEQAAYLAGAAAALTSSTQHLGFVAGADDARSRALQAGFVAGARRIAEDITVDVAVVPPGSDGPDVAAATAAAQAQLAAGADVLMGVPEAVNDAVVAVAAGTGGSARAVGLGRDVAAADPALQAAVLTSALVHAEPVVFGVIEAFAEGRLDATVAGAAEGAIAYAPSPALTPDLAAQLDELLDLLASNGIQVPVAP